jgi:hypothetical protein
MRRRGLRGSGARGHRAGELLVYDFLFCALSLAVGVVGGCVHVGSHGVLPRV